MQVGQVQAGVAGLGDGFMQNGQSEPTQHFFRTVTARNRIAPRVPRERIIYVFADPRPAQSILEAVSKRMEDAIGIGDTECAFVSAKPF